ncbi:MAG: TIGR00725 family protein [Candidatus Lokiarchaeota archaeon]|nr:TIGR00725 family protein [Candidatus Lokiarchaeota archaeon]
MSFKLEYQLDDTDTVIDLEKTIAVIGGSDTSGRGLELAEEVGAEIAKHGYVLVCGGLGGVMEAACKGAKRHGGVTVGILPTEKKLHANPFVDIAIPTGMGYLRNFLVARGGDAVIAIAGSAGTLSEMAIAWFSDRPLIALVESGGWAKKLAGQKIDHRRSDSVYAAQSAEEAVQAAVESLESE